MQEHNWGSLDNWLCAATLVLLLALTVHSALLTASKWKSMLHAASHCLCPLLART